MSKWHSICGVVVGNGILLLFGCGSVREGDSTSLDTPTVGE